MIAALSYALVIAGPIAWITYRTLSLATLPF